MDAVTTSRPAPMAEAFALSTQLLRRLARLGGGSMRVQICLNDATPTKPCTPVSPWVQTMAEALRHAAAAHQRYGAGQCSLHYRESI